MYGIISLAPGTAKDPPSQKSFCTSTIINAFHFDDLINKFMVNLIDKRIAWI